MSKVFRQLFGIFAKRLGIRVGFIVAIVVMLTMAVPTLAAASGPWRSFGGYNSQPPVVYHQPAQSPTYNNPPQNVQSPSSFDFGCSVAFPSQYGTANISGTVGGVSVNFSSQNTSYSATFSGTAGTIYTNNVHYTFEYEHISCTDNKLIVQGADSLQRSFSLTAENRNGQMTATLRSALYNVSGTFVGTMSIVPVHN
jgi:hypothetical protein